MSRVLSWMRHTPEVVFSIFSNEENKVYNLSENETIFIPQESKHRLANKSDKNLVIIEMWYGDKLDENDIIRYDDIYGRK